MHKPRRTAVLHDAACESANKEQHGEVCSIPVMDNGTWILMLVVSVHADVAVAVAVFLVAVV